MNFIKRIKQNTQLKKDIAIAKIIDKPLQENIISIIYSININKDVSVLVLERSNWIYPWAGKLQFGTMGKRMDNDPLSEALRITREKSEYERTMEGRRTHQVSKTQEKLPAAVGLGSESKTEKKLKKENLRNN